jgi:uncharacterized protein (TIGR00251 family)
VIADAPDGAILSIKVIPRAGRTALAGTRDGSLLVRLAAAPVDGAANAALIAFLAATLGIPRSRVVLIAGDKSRTKRVKVIGMSAAAIRARLERA